jgi:hypothetical protein
MRRHGRRHADPLIGYLDICALPNENHLTGIAVQALAIAKIWATAGV